MIGDDETMFCTVIDIYGDYAYLKYDDSSPILQYALALLPYEIDIGTRLYYENYEFHLA